MVLGQNGIARWVALRGCGSDYNPLHGLRPLPLCSYAMRDVGWGPLTSNTVPISFMFLRRKEEGPSSLLLLRLVKPWPWGLADQQRWQSWGTHSPWLLQPSAWLWHGACHLGGVVRANHASMTEPT